MNSRIALIAAVLITPFSLMAQEEPKSPWTGKATLGYLATSGNTETSTLNTGFEVGYTTGQWVHLAKASAIKASENEVSTAEAYNAGWKSEWNITDANFDEMIINGTKPALVDFGAVWCHPCKTLEPSNVAVAAEYADRITVGKLDIDESQKVAQQFGIMSVPTVIFVKDGKEVHRFVGVQSKEKIADLIQSHLL